VATDGQGAQTTSNARTITVAANQPPTVSLTQPANNSSYLPPASITLKANATAPEDNDTVARVDFFANGTLIGSDTTKAFTFTWDGPAPGTYTLTAVATDGQGAQTTSNARTVNVDAANLPPTVSLTAPANKATFAAGATIALKANASPPEANDTVARVDFFDGATLVGSASAAPYTASITNAAPGTHVLTAVATDGQGAQTTSAARTITVTGAANQPPAVSFASPADGASFTAPATIPLSVNASDPDGTVASVTFFQGASVIGTVSVAPFTFNWMNVAAGSYAVTAVATDNAGAATTSTAINITVTSGVAQIYYIVPDQLNTPRLVQDQNGNAVWRWGQQEPFGVSQPNADPDGDGISFDFPLRFPGQYADRETNLAYNFFRDYDPGLGRYIQSDIVGLKGGTNTYSYALQNPFRYVDILGLDVNFCYYPDFPTHIGFGIVGEGAKTQSFYPERHRSPIGPGIVKPDPSPGDEPRECKTVVATPKQDKCMLACRERRKNKPGTYNGVTRQCTEFVRDCALECNVPVGNHGGPLPNWFYDGIKASDFPE
jgi:RHS repeat-associated protein